MALRLTFRVGKNRGGLLIISPLSLPVFRREDWLLPDKEQVKRSIGFFGLFNGEIQCSSDTSYGAKHRRTGCFADRSSERLSDFRFPLAVCEPSSHGLLLGPFSNESAQNQSKDKNRGGKQPGVRFVDKQRELDCRHDDERTEHQGPLPQSQVEFFISRRGTKISRYRSNDTDSIEIGQTGNVLDRHHQQCRDYRGDD